MGRRWERLAAEGVAGVQTGGKRGWGAERVEDWVKSRVWSGPGQPSSEPLQGHGGKRIRGWVTHKRHPAAWL